MNMAVVIGGPAIAAVLIAAGLTGATLLTESAAAPGPAAQAERLAAGERLYERCAACHSLDHDRTGPRHCGLLGRRAGSIAGFGYTEAMRRSGIVWTEDALDRFLAAPVRVVPGTSMGYAGIDDARERRDLIAYLREAAAACG